MLNVTAWQQRYDQTPRNADRTVVISAYTAEDHVNNVILFNTRMLIFTELTLFTSVLPEMIMLTNQHLKR